MILVRINLFHILFVLSSLALKARNSTSKDEIASPKIVKAHNPRKKGSFCSICFFSYSAYAYLEKQNALLNV